MHVRPGRPAGSATRPTEQRASDQAKLAELYLHGFSTADMAVRLGLTRRTVQAELSAIRKDWRTRTHLDFQSALFQQLDRIFGARRALRVPRIAALPERVMQLYGELKK